MKLGYARVSTENQNLDLQIRALKRAGCRKIFTDHGVSGAAFSRPGLDDLLAHLRPGHTLIVWRLDRLGRSLRDLVDMIHRLGQQKVHFVSLTENISTESAGGMLLFHMMAALAEFERALISERTRAGMAAARARGRPLGRRHAIDDQQRLEVMKALKSKRASLRDLARRYQVHPRTLRRALERVERRAWPTE